MLVVTLSTGVLATACGHHSAWHLEAVPPTFRAVEVAGSASPFVGKHTTKLPITLSRAQRNPDGESVSVFRGRRVWFVNAYLGGDVSPHDPTLEAIVRTIRFNR